MNTATISQLPIQDVIQTVPRTAADVASAFHSGYKLLQAFMAIAKNLPDQIGVEAIDAFRASTPEQKVIDVLRLLKRWDEVRGVKGPVGETPNPLAPAPAAPIVAATPPAVEATPTNGRKRRSPGHVNGTPVEVAAPVTEAPAGHVEAPPAPPAAYPVPVGGELATIQARLENLEKSAFRLERTLEEIKSLLVTTHEHQNLVSAVNHLISQGQKNFESLECGQIGLGSLLSAFIGEVLKGDPEEFIPEAVRVRGGPAAEALVKLLYSMTPKAASSKKTGKA